MWRDDSRLLDMLVSARRAREFVQGISRDEFLASDLHQAAVMRALEILGEAARGVSEEARAEHPEIAWTDIIGMRSKLIHEYFRVNVEVVWDVVATDLEPLIAKLEAIVPPEEP